MQPAYHPLAQIFGTQTRHLVPLFQRPYVWNQEDQWEPLWEDIADLASRVLSGQKPIAGHFLGTVVLEQVHTPSGAVNRREVIDGQQRLTTLQIVLQAAKLAFASIQLSSDDVAKAARIEGSRIEALTANPAGYEEEEKYKVWPSNEDRAAFQQIMDATNSDELSSVQTRMGQAFSYFLARIREWLGGEDLGHRIPALSSALKDHLRLIVLDLDESDEPQAIFETLNAHGTPLLPADLIKNWLLWQFARDGLDAASPYTQHWSPFDHDAEYWRQRIGSGHAARARIDTFLQSWLIRRERQPVSTKHLYDRFLRYAQSGGKHPAERALAVLGDISSHGRLFREIDAPGGRTRFQKCLMRLKALDMVVFQPVILALMDRAASDGMDRDSAAQALESYLIRRMLCGGQTRGYGTLAIELLDVIENVGGDAAVAPSMARYLDELTGPLAWPTDASFEFAWRNSIFYGYFRRNRVLMILQALEEYLQTESTKGEPIVAFDFSSLTIEHILPQKWQEHWEFSGDESARMHRDRKLHGIGNLTLVSGVLNPALSNAAWVVPEGSTGTSKFRELKKHTKLQLNAKLLEGWPDSWDENGIAERSQALFAVARQIWPGPQTLQLNTQRPLNA